MSLLETPQLLPIEAILTSLLNDISAFPYQFTLVLDDYHLIDSIPVDQALTFLIEHLPKQMHLVIITREDPQLPLARLRAQGRLTELRANDLRFSPAETAEFLNQVMSLSLSAEDITALDKRTEGWIAGLQLAALSMQGREDVHGFIRSFAGDDRYIVDYLVEEVLKRQPRNVLSFLLQTSILDRMNGSLCDAVTGQSDSSAILAALQRGNFFVIPLDDKRHWYRYHHLFAEVLHLHLMAEQPDQVPALHRHASEWYEHNGSLVDAIHHALAGEDFERAADLIELSIPALSQSRQVIALLGWLKSLPNVTVRARPVLSVAYAHLLLDGGEVDGVEYHLQDAEFWLDPQAKGHTQSGASPFEMTPESNQRMVVVDDEAFRRLPGAIAVARAGLALAHGDVTNTEKYARQVLDLLPEDDHLNRGGVAGFLGLAAWTSGNLEAAHQAFAEGMTHLQKAGNISDVIGGAVTLADIRLAQGRPHESMRTYEQALLLATAQDKSAISVRGTADLYVGLSELHLEHNDLYAATQQLQRSKELGEHTGFPQNRYRWRVAMARIQEAQGNLDSALDLLDEAERLFVRAFSPNVRPIQALKARVWVSQGRLREALDWGQNQGLSAADELSYQHEYEHITLARILLTQYKKGHVDNSILEAMGLLDRLLKAARKGGRGESVIEILILQALALQALDDIPAAIIPLQQALTLAEPEGYIRLFVAEGSPMAQLLLEAVTRGIMPDYTGKLLEAIQLEQQTALAVLPASGGSWLVHQKGQTQVEPKAKNLTSLARNAEDSSREPTPTSQSQIEPLSQRELEILRLFKTELSGPEIASELVIALSTVRTHTKSIFSKLNVNNRRAAVKRAAELDLK
jgi:LuxR family maltose regulon positive regulatory protein